MKRRILAMLLMLAMILPCFTGQASAATSGSCGDDLTWKVASGVLTISGSGKMADYNIYAARSAPWYSNREKITSVVIKSGVTSIGVYAFVDCSNLTKITIPDSVASIGHNAFRNCSSLTTVTIPKSITSIALSTFYGCSSLTAVTIPDSVTSIVDWAFWGCSKLSAIDIPNSVTDIGQYAFGQCTSLTSVTIPKSVTNIAGAPFAGCTNLKSIYVNKNNPAYSNDASGVLFNKNQTELIQVPGAATTYTIPKTVLSIGYGAFESCTSLSTVTIPDGVIDIGDYAFSGCINLSAVKIPEGVASIGRFAFMGTGLKSITFPASVTSIGSGAFCPSSEVTDDGELLVGCNNLSEIVFKGDAPTIGDSCFEGATATAYYPAGNDTWTDDVRQDYEGTITWVEVLPFEKRAVTVSCSADTASGKPKVSWGELMDAEKYRVYRATSKTGTYDYLATSTGTDYIDKSAVVGTNYYYKVKALDTDTNTYSEYSNIVNRVCDLAQPTISLTVNAITGKPVVKWETVEGAAKYYIYRSTKKSSGYEKVYTGIKARSYEDANAVAGTNYYYKVMAIHEVSAANSAYSSVVNRVCDLAKPVVSITRSNGDPKISWETVEGAEKYYIYRATSKDGTYKQVKTAVSARSYTDTSAVAGKTYYYKVMAIHSNSAANSAYSSIKYITAK